MTVPQLFVLCLSAALVQHSILMRAPGAAAVPAGLQKAGGAAVLGLGVMTVMTLSSMISWAVNALVLERLGGAALRGMAYVLVTAGLVHLAELGLKRTAPGRYAAYCVCFPLITGNSAVLGVALLYARGGDGFFLSGLYGALCGLGFTLAIALFQSISRRLDCCGCPRVFQGIPIALVAAGLLSMVFMGFPGLRLW